MTEREPKKSRRVKGYGEHFSPLGRYIKRRLSELEMTQLELAERLGTNRQRLARWMRGPGPSGPELVALARVLQVDASVLLDAARGGTRKPSGTRVAHIAEQLQRLVDDSSEERGAELLDAIEAMLRDWRA